MEGAELRQMNVRVPSDLCNWIQGEKARNKSSLSSEITRAIRERKEREEVRKPTK